MKYLLDTNVIIPVEPTSPENVESDTPTAVELLRLIAEGPHQMYVHPASIKEMKGDCNTSRRNLRETLAQKYPLLPSPPPVPPDLDSVLGKPSLGSHDYVDHLLLAAVHADAVDLLVTNDRRLIKKARRLGLASRVLTPVKAIAALRGLFRNVPLPPPAVQQIYAHQLDEKDPIFDSFRADYPGFNDWLRKCKLQHRTGWIILDHSERLAGVCIVKDERDKEHGLDGHVLKLCSLKIASNAHGFRFGELLLKTVFAYAFTNKYDHAYVEILPKYKDLTDLLESLGFQPLSGRTSKGELVLAKPLKFLEQDYQQLGALDFHVSFGPRYLKVEEAFVVPIWPKYHDLLFPELAQQDALFSRTNAFGNSIQKAYLCRSPIRRTEPGSTLLFYESKGNSHVRCVGVLEETMVSQNPKEVARFVGQRTVYTLKDIERMCSSPILAILFRQAFLPEIAAQPFTIEQLINNGVLKGAPRSITKVREGGLHWVRDQIELWP